MLGDDIPVDLASGLRLVSNDNHSVTVLLPTVSDPEPSGFVVA